MVSKRREERLSSARDNFITETDPGNPTFPGFFVLPAYAVFFAEKFFENREKSMYYQLPGK